MGSGLASYRPGRSSTPIRDYRLTSDPGRISGGVRGGRAPPIRGGAHKRPVPALPPRRSCDLGRRWPYHRRHSAATLMGKPSPGGGLAASNRNKMRTTNPESGPYGLNPPGEKNHGGFTDGWRIPPVGSWGPMMDLGEGEFAIKPGVGK